AAAARLIGTGAYLSVKAPPLGFCPARLRALANAGATAGMPLMLDAHGPADAEATIAATEQLLADFPGTGCVLPARWRRSSADAGATVAATGRLLADFRGTGGVLPARGRRSSADAVRLRDTPARIRIVKGEWSDPDADPADADVAYLALVSGLAGRAAPVAIA